MVTTVFYSSTGAVIYQSQGSRLYQEDRGGADFLMLFAYLPAHERIQVLKQVFENLNQDLRASYFDHAYTAGSTFCLSILCGNTVYVANLGDSESYIVEEAKEEVRCKRINRIHHLTLANYKQLQEQGLKVEPDSRNHPRVIRYENENKVHGLNVYGTMGDFIYDTSNVLRTPDIYEHEVSLSNNTNVFVINATDGIAECASYQKGMTTESFVKSRIESLKKEERTLENISRALGSINRQVENSDNITIATMLLKSDGPARYQVVFDGHGSRCDGRLVSDFLIKHIGRHLNVLCLEYFVKQIEQAQGKQASLAQRFWDLIVKQGKFINWNKFTFRATLAAIYCHYIEEMVRSPVTAKETLKKLKTLVHTLDDFHVMKPPEPVVLKIIGILEANAKSKSFCHQEMLQSIKAIITEYKGTARIESLKESHKSTMESLKIIFSGVLTPRGMSRIPEQYIQVCSLENEIGLQSQSAPFPVLLFDNKIKSAINQMTNQSQKLEATKKILALIAKQQAMNLFFGNELEAEFQEMNTSVLQNLSLQFSLSEQLDQYENDINVLEDKKLMIAYLNELDQKLSTTTRLFNWFSTGQTKTAARLLAKYHQIQETSLPINEKATLKNKILFFMSTKYPEFSQAFPDTLSEKTTNKYLRFFKQVVSLQVFSAPVEEKAMHDVSSVSDSVPPANKFS